jgi:guanylate kinase
MKKYHITYLEKDGDLVSTGQNVEARDEVQALEVWRNRNPHAVFLYLASPEMLAYKC